ncbi:MAG: exonuclease domain-containing protein [Nanoarchaeota archaeon]
MITVDLEMSGLNSDKCGVWQIGAVDLKTKEFFIEEAKIDKEDMVEEGALKIIGKSEIELRDKKKQTQKELITNFFKWAKSRAKTIVGEVPQLDVEFLTKKARKYRLDYPFHHRTFDLHSVAQTKYFEIKGKFLFKDNHSELGTTGITAFCGIENILFERNHDALEDAKLVAECFTRLIRGRKFLPEYSSYKIPRYLLK